MNTSRQIPFAKVNIGESERKYIAEVLDSGWLTTARKTIEFENRFAEFIGVKYACAVNSCTAALHLGIEALGVQPGDKVFVPSMTFTATAEIIRYLNADPVFLDTEYGSNLITPEILQRAIFLNKDVRYLILVHFGGHPAQMFEIMEICKKNNILILEDAAHAFPAQLDGKMIGSFGNITCFSFYANKTITTGEGGMLVTDDERIYERVKTMRLHGINRDIWDRFSSSVPSWEYDVYEAGYKYNMPDINAAIGLGQLERAEEMRLERQKIAASYLEALSDITSIDLPICKVKMEEHAWHLFTINLNDDVKLTRNQFIETMSEYGIGTSVHYKPLHQMTYYKHRYKLLPSDYPIAENTWIRNVSLPIYPYMDEQDMIYIQQTIHEIL